MELLLKRASQGKFSSWMREHQALMRKVSTEQYIDLSLEYALQVSQEKAEEIIDIFEATYPELKEAIMTAARQLERRGEERGIQQGMQEGLQVKALEIAQNMLESGLEVSLIAQVTGLEEETIRKFSRK